jgi:hypothetical protein
MLSGRFIGVVAIALFASGTRSAIASPEFPSVVQQTLHLSETPQCALCHGLGKTGFYTVNTAFGMTMLDYGALPGNDDTIRAALIQLQANQSPLIADLIAGRDPNREAGDPRYGCGSSAAPSEPSLTLFLALASVLWFQRSRLVRRRLKVSR